MRHKWLILFLLQVILFFAACSSTPTVTTTNPLLEKETMVSFLTELHLKEAFINERYASGRESSWLFSDLFDRYKVTAQQFDEAILFYKQDHKNYIALYMQVTERLKREEKKIESGIYRYYDPPVTPIWTYYGKFPAADTTLVKYTDYLFYLQLPATELRTHHSRSYPYIQRLSGRTPYWKIGD